MHVETLKVFCDVARLRSFSQAAQANDVTQSAASQAVRHLERRLGVQLIDRSTRPLQMTTLGKAYYEGCKGLVEQYLELEASIRSASSELALTVQVAAIYSVGLSDMGHHLERFRALHPEAKVHVDYLHPDQVYERVRDGTADLGLVSFPRAARDLVVLPWREEPMVLACPPEHPLARVREVRPADLEGVAYVGFEKGLTIRRVVDRFLREQGVTVEVELEFDNIENIKKAVAVAAGVALLPEPTFRDEVEAGTLVAVPLAGGQLVRPLGILRRRQGRLSATALRFIELLRESSETPQAHGPQSNGTVRDRNGTPRRSKRTM